MRILQITEDGRMSRNEVPRELKKGIQAKMAICPIFLKRVRGQTDCEECLQWFNCGAVNYPRQT